MPHKSSPALEELASILHAAIFSDVSPTGWHRASSCPYATAWALLGSEFVQMKETSGLYEGCLRYLLQSQRPNGAWGRLLHEQLIMTPYAYVALHLVYERTSESEQFALQRALLSARSFLRMTGAMLYPQLPEGLLRCFRPVCLLAERADHPEWVELLRRHCPPASKNSGMLPASEEMCFQLANLYDLFPKLWESSDPKDLEELESRQLQNGSWWCVTDFTVLALLTMEFREGTYTARERGWQYLLMAQNSDGGLPQFHDCELFLSAYVGFAYAALVKSIGLSFPEELRRLEPWLRAIQHDSGFWSFTSAFPGGDLDDTAWVVLWLVDGCGVSPSDPAIERAISALVAHQLPDGAFPSWAGLVGDPDVTAHVLQALLATGKEDRASELARAYLFSIQKPNGAWQGSWHHSLVYGTAQVVHALMRGPSDEPTRAKLRHGFKYLLSQLTGESEYADQCGTIEEIGMILWGLAAFASAEEETLLVSKIHLWNIIQRSLGELWTRIIRDGLDSMEESALWIAQFSYTAQPLQLAAIAAIAKAAVEGCVAKNLGAI